MVFWTNCNKPELGHLFTCMQGTYVIRSRRSRPSADGPSEQAFDPFLALSSFPPSQMERFSDQLQDLKLAQYLFLAIYLDL